MKKIKVLVVDDSPLFRRFILDGLAAYDFIDLVGYAVDPIDAQEKIKKLHPDVITSDVEMPRMDGITFVKKMMAEDPVRIIVVSSVNISVFDAISAGAIDFVRKPSGKDKEADSQFLADLADKILIASQAKLKTAAAPRKPATVQPSDSGVPRKPVSSAVSSSAAGSSAAQTSAQSGAKKAAEPDILIKSLEKVNDKGKVPLIALGASTGGTEALLSVVKDLPANTPGIVIVQHMPAGFTKMYADRLNKVCRMRAKEAQNGDKIEKGLILIAPGDLQMSVVKSLGTYSVRCVPGNKVSGHRPSVDVMFSSVAKVASPGAIGVILTGMGADGAKGLLEMKKSGCFTIGQDEESCVVYGMPMMAYNMGAVVRQAPLDRIAGLIVNQISK